MYYKLPNLRGGRVIGPNDLDLNESNHESHTYPVEGWTWFDSPLEAIAQIGWEPPGEMVLSEYDPQDPEHLRIYGVTDFPSEVARRYAKFSPPADYDWSLLGLQKASLLGATDLGDIPEMRYSAGGVDVARRLFAFAYSTDANGATELAVTETPGWVRNDGTWVDGEPRTQVYIGQRYNEWRDSARRRIFAALKTWLPLVLVALGEVADVPAGEALSGGWLAANHAAPWNLYMETGRKELITQSITADTTSWLSEVVPDETVTGLESGKTVRELILESLR